MVILYFVNYYGIIFTDFILMFIEKCNIAIIILFQINTDIFWF